MSSSTGFTHLASALRSRWPFPFGCGVVQERVSSGPSWRPVLWLRSSGSRFSYLFPLCSLGWLRGLLLALGIAYALLSSIGETLYSNAWRQSDPVMTISGLLLAKAVWPLALDIRRGPAAAGQLGASVMPNSLVRPLIQSGLSWDPHSPDLLGALALSETLAGNEDEARALARKTRSLIPKETLQ